MAQLEQELKRLQRRKTLLGSATSLTGLPSPSSVNKEQPLFTLRQVTLAILLIALTQKFCKVFEKGVNVELVFSLVV